MTEILRIKQQACDSLVAKNICTAEEAKQVIVLTPIRPDARTAFLTGWIAGRGGVVLPLPQRRIVIGRSEDIGEFEPVTALKGFLEGYQWILEPAGSDFRIMDAESSGGSEIVAGDTGPISRKLWTRLPRGTVLSNQYGKFVFDFFSPADRPSASRKPD